MDEDERDEDSEGWVGAKDEGYDRLDKIIRGMRLARVRHTVRMFFF